MQLDSKVYSRKEILELPYQEFVPGKLWTPRAMPSPQNLRPLRWTTVLFPEQLKQIESKEEYFWLLTRRVEWLIEQAIEDWLMTYEAQEENEANFSVAQEINQHLPMYMNSLDRQQSPGQMATYLVTNYQELQRECLTEQQFPVSPYPTLETGLSYLGDMNLIDWLMWMNMDANPHYFQD